jgi:hypothetical protein
MPDLGCRIPYRTVHRAEATARNAKPPKGEEGAMPPDVPSVPSGLGVAIVEVLVSSTEITVVVAVSATSVGAVVIVSSGIEQQLSTSNNSRFVVHWMESVSNPMTMEATAEHFTATSPSMTSISPSVTTPLGHRVQGFSALGGQQKNSFAPAMVHSSDPASNPPTYGARSEQVTPVASISPVKVMPSGQKEHGFAAIVGSVGAVVIVSQQLSTSNSSSPVVHSSDPASYPMTAEAKSEHVITTPSTSISPSVRTPLGHRVQGFSALGGQQNNSSAPNKVHSSDPASNAPIIGAKSEQVMLTPMTSISPVEVMPSGQNEHGFAAIVGQHNASYTVHSIDPDSKYEAVEITSVHVIVVPSNSTSMVEVMPFGQALHGFVTCCAPTQPTVAVTKADAAMRD